MGELEAWQGLMRNILLPRCADDPQHQSQKQLDNEGRGLMTHDPSEGYNHTELTKVIISLAHNLMDLKQGVNNLMQQIRESRKELTHPQRHTDQLEIEAQARHKDPDEIKILQKTLTTAEQRDQLEKSLFHKESLLKTANSELLDKDARIGACESHLKTSRARIEALTLQLDNSEDKLDMVRRELRRS